MDRGPWGVALFAHETKDFLKEDTHAHEARSRFALLAVAAFTAIVGFSAIVARTRKADLDPWMDPVGIWLSCLVLLTALALALGGAFTGTWHGIFLSSRNLLSLAQVQFVAFTVVSMAAVLTLVLLRLRGHDPPDIVVPDGVLMLMGVSGGSLVASKAVLSRRIGQAPSPEAVVRNGQQLLRRKRRHIGRTMAEIQRWDSPRIALARVELGRNLVQRARADKGLGTADLPMPSQEELWAIGYLHDRAEGVLFSNPSPKDARLTDLLEGDEVGSTHSADFGKVQMLLFTLVGLIAYVGALHAFFYANTGCNLDCPTHLPPFPETLVGLLGLSHVGYVGGKMAGHTALA